MERVGVGEAQEIEEGAVEENRDLHAAHQNADRQAIKNGGRIGGDIVENRRQRRDRLRNHHTGRRRRRRLRGLIDRRAAARPALLGISGHGAHGRQINEVANTLGAILAGLPA